MLFSNRSPYAQKHRNEEETYFLDENCKQIKFPSLSDQSTVELSVIVPAYNEQFRCKSNVYKHVLSLICELTVLLNIRI